MQIKCSNNTLCQPVRPLFVDSEDQLCPWCLDTDLEMKHISAMPPSGWNVPGIEENVQSSKYVPAGESKKCTDV